jgi:hypothetical protein
MPKFKIFVTVVVICCLPVQLAMAHTIAFGTQPLALAPYSGGVDNFDSVQTRITRAPTPALTPPPNSLMMILREWSSY